MSRALAVIAKLRSLGIAAEEILEVVELMSARSSGAERTARYRERKKSEQATSVTCDVTCDVTGGAKSPPIKSPPITPIKLTPPTSLRSDTSAREIFANEFWPAYPRKTERKAAETKFLAVVKSGVDPILLVDGARRYAASKPEPKFTKHATTWLSKGCWEDELLPRAGPKPNGRSVLAQMATGEYWENHDEQSSQLHGSPERPFPDDAGAGNHAGEFSKQAGMERRGTLLDLRPEGPGRTRAA